MIELPQVLDAFAGDGVVLHMAAPATLDEEAVKELLAGLDVEVEGVERKDDAVF